jgi:endonuclease I
MKRTITFISALYLLTISIFAQIPAGYYDSAIGKMKAELKTALHLKIKNANVPSYGSGAGSTWAAFAKTDVRPEDGTVWDMYSNNHVAFNGNSAASGMNIEHSFAKSWWGDGRQAAQDVMHLAPSNSTANSAKGSWPMAVVDGTTTFSNGVIKVGKSSSRPGGVIDAWEPADEYKGDFSRAYMYMVTAYEDYVTYWTGNSVNQLDNNTYPVFEQWTVDLLLKWSKQDPVSQKEIMRNNEVYKIQGNRNPYIDYPLMSEYVWGSLTTVPFSPDGNVNYPYISTPTNGSIVDFGKVVFLQNLSSTLNIKALNLTGDLSLAISGTDAANFSIATSTLTKANAEAGYNLTIFYNAKTVGTHTAQLTISGGGITNTVVNLKAIASDEFLALPASNISNSGFTANWTVSANATDYSLNVFSLQNSGTTQAQTLIEENFTSSLPTGWLSPEYTDTQTAGFVRIASSGSSGKLIFPALDLSSTGNVLTVRAKQYVNDTGAQLTATINDQPLAVWTTGSANQDFTVIIPQSTSASKIALLAAAGSRVYVDYVKVETQGSVKTAVSLAGYPKSVGNLLFYNINGLKSDSSYYYTVTPQGNSALVSNQIQVRTTFANGTLSLQNILPSYVVLSNGIKVTNLASNCKLSVFDLMGKQIQTIITNSSEVEMPLPQKGIYILQVQQNQNINTIKILY